jgi:hypothetical protein
MWRHFNARLPDILKELLFISIDKHKRRLSSEHFIDNAAYTPPVYSETMSLSIDNLWCKVLWGTAQSQCIIVALDVFLGKSEIGQLGIPIFIDKDILWFQISINNLVLV